MSKIRIKCHGIFLAVFLKRELILASYIFSVFLAFAIDVGAALVQTLSEVNVVLTLLRTKPIPAICRSFAAAICAHGSIA